MKIIETKLTCKMCRGEKKPDDFYKKHKICKTCHKAVHAAKRAEKRKMDNLFIG